VHYKLIRSYHPKWKPISILLLLLILQIGIIATLFLFNILQPPRSILDYGAGMLILGPATLIFFEKLLKWLFKKGFIVRNKKGKNSKLVE
jgi:membrane protease YdiL (CAAX protease family)